MSEKREIFADRIGEINFAGEMVRFDFMTLQPVGDGQPPVPQSCFRVIISTGGFLDTFNTMQSLIDKMVDAGVLQKIGDAPAAAAAPVAVAPAAEKPVKAKAARPAKKETAGKETAKKSAKAKAPARPRAKKKEKEA